MRCSDCAYAHAGLRLSPEDRFSRIEAHIVFSYFITACSKVKTITRGAAGFPHA